jgi:hypothetical protein
MLSRRFVIAGLQFAVVTPAADPEFIRPLTDSPLAESILLFGV